MLVNDANDQTLYAIVLSFHDPHIVVWDVKSGHRAQRIPLPEAVRHRVCITADDTQLLLCDDAHLLVRVNDTTVLQYVIGQDEFGMVLELRDGHFNVDRGIVLQQCWTMSGTGEENAVEMLAVTRDGRVIVDWAQTVQLHVLREHMSTFTDIHLGADIIGAEFQSDSKDYFYPRHIITVTKRGIVRCHVCRSTIGSEFTLDSRWSLSASLTDGEFARTMHVDWSMHLLYIGTRWVNFNAKFYVISKTIPLRVIITALVACSSGTCFNGVLSHHSTSIRVLTMFDCSLTSTTHRGLSSTQEGPVEASTVCTMIPRLPPISFHSPATAHPHRTTVTSSKIGLKI